MSKLEKLLTQDLRGVSDANIPFDGLCGLLRHLEFNERMRGSHHIFTKDSIEEILNCSPLVLKPKHIRSNRFAA